MDLGVRLAVVVVGALCWTALPVVPDGRLDAQIAGLVILAVVHMAWSATAMVRSGGAAHGWLAEWLLVLVPLVLCMILVELKRAPGLCTTRVTAWEQRHYGGLSGSLVHVRRVCWNAGEDPSRVHEVWLGLFLGPSVPFRG